MKCDYEQKISMLIDGELSAAESVKIRKHLAECEDCQSSKGNFLFFRNEIKKPSADTILANIDCVINASEKTSVPRRRFISLAPAFGLIALICAGFGIWYFAFYPGKSEHVSAEREVKEAPKNNLPDDFSLARFDKGGRAEIYVAPRAKNENQ